MCLDTYAQSIQSEHQFREGMDDIKSLEQIDRVYTALTQDNGGDRTPRRLDSDDGCDS